MRFSLRAPLAALSLVYALTVGAVAQTPVAIILNTGDVMLLTGINPANPPVTVFPGKQNGTLVGIDIESSVDNRGLAMLHQDVSAGAFVLREAKNGTIQTFASIPTTIVPGSAQIGGIATAEDGTYVIGTEQGIYRVQAPGFYTTLSPILAANIVENPVAGGWTIRDANGNLLDITENGVVTTFSAIGALGTAGNALAVDPDTADVALITGSLSTLEVATVGRTSGQIVNRLPEFAYGLDYDTASRNITLMDGVVLLRVFEYDRQGRQGRLVAFGVGGFGLPVGHEIIGTRHVSSLVEPRAGARYQFLVSFPTEPGASYQCALSLASRPGIQTAAGRISLAPDPLFALSLTPGGVFKRFAGALDSRGEAVPEILIPSGTRGLRVHCAAVAYRQGTILRVSQPFSIEIK